MLEVLKGRKKYSRKAKGHADGYLIAAAIPKINAIKDIICISASKINIDKCRDSGNSIFFRGRSLTVCCRIYLSAKLQLSLYHRGEAPSTISGILSWE